VKLTIRVARARRQQPQSEHVADGERIARRQHRDHDHEHDEKCEQRYRPVH
jgi:hypothetical protein